MGLALGVLVSVETVRGKGSDWSGGVVEVSGFRIWCLRVVNPLTGWVGPIVGLFVVFPLSRGVGRVIGFIPIGPFSPGFPLGILWWLIIGL